MYSVGTQETHRLTVTGESLRSPSLEILLCTQASESAFPCNLPVDN